jgi:hypothetical protein
MACRQPGNSLRIVTHCEPPLFENTPTHVLDLERDKQPASTTRGNGRDVRSSLERTHVSIRPCRLRASNLYAL